MIIRFSGNLGAGKTYSMVARLVQMFKQAGGMQVYTNISSLSCPEAIYFCDIMQVCDISYGIVLLDEAAIVLPAQFWQDMGREFLTRLNQLRKFRLDLLYTSQRETGANVNLRDLTNETVLCSRAGRFILQRSQDPNAKASAGFGRPVLRRQEIYDLYDTYEAIDANGSSLGSPDFAALSTLARRRHDEDERRKAAKAARLKPLLAERWWIGRRDRPEALYLPASAQKVLRWLKEEGHYDDQQPFGPQLRRELLRRRWLETWGMKPGDAPLDCLPHSPWLRGFAPADVIPKWRKEQADRALDEAAAKAAFKDATRSRASQMKPPREHFSTVNRA